MQVRLNDEECRALGCLIEKSMATPEYYPMSLNAVVAACNQKSSRDPVVSYDERTVRAALDGLRDKHLLWVVTGPDARVPKYKHRFPEAFDLDEAETAAMCVLMLRGPQTPGEIRGRTGRLHAFDSVAEAAGACDRLAGKAPVPLAVKLPVQQGRKESRFAHTLVAVDLPEGGAAPERELIEAWTDGENRMDRLEFALESLREDVRRLEERLSRVEGCRENQENREILD